MLWQENVVFRNNKSCRLYPHTWAWHNGKNVYVGSDHTMIRYSQDQPEKRNNLGRKPYNYFQLM